MTTIKVNKTSLGINKLRYMTKQHILAGLRIEKKKFDIPGI